MTVFRMDAMTCGLVPAAAAERSSSNVTSRTQCSLFSTAQWPWIHAARVAWSAVAIAAELMT